MDISTLSQLAMYLTPETLLAVAKQLDEAEEVQASAVFLRELDSRLTATVRRAIQAIADTHP